MKKITEIEANDLGIKTIHHEMDNHEKRFRLVTNTSSYILTLSSNEMKWQNSHVHYEKKEFYLIEKGWAIIALWDKKELTIKKLYKDDSIFIPIGVAHNLLLSSDAILHTIKYGSEKEDWNPCIELDEMLTKIELNL